MDYYSELGEGYLKLHREEQEEKFKVLTKYLKHNKQDKLLDVGCGPGWAKEFFQCDYTGIDPAVGLVKLGKNCIVGRGEELAFPDNSFDLIICVSALHNMQSPSKALDEMKRVSKPGTKLGLTILKRSSKATMLLQLIKKKFTVLEEIKNRHDRILICKT